MIKVSQAPKRQSVSGQVNLLRITEIFKSLQGETSYQGFVTTFIRLTGCPLRCQYCDTAYAFKGGQKLSFDHIMTKVKSLGSPYVCVTGGEPLAQKPAYQLINKLADERYKVSVETSGAMCIKGLDEKVKIILDVKTPDSLESDKNLESNYCYLKPLDEVKFVICSKNDFDWTMGFIEKHLSHISASQILISPSFTQVKPEDLASWLIESNRDYKMQLQLHKYLWGDKTGV